MDGWVGIRYLNGPRLRRALIASARELLRVRGTLDRINVFPVADGDTGTNMSGTLGCVVDGIHGSGERSLHGMLRAAADLALEGARGSSGTIFAQFLHGLAEELRDAARIGTRHFGARLRLAVAYPYSAVSEPREGTILTVLREWADSVLHWSERTEDFAELLTRAYPAAVKSLEETRGMLPALERAGVVDAGAMGLVSMLGGITDFIARGTVREQAVSPLLVDGEPEPRGEGAEEPSRRFCTQLVVEGTDLDAGALKAAAAGLGDSLIVAGSRERLKLHIHTDRPDLVVDAAEALGRVSGQRVEDMVAQFRAAHLPHPGVALVVDSACDIPADLVDRYGIHMVPCVLLQGERTYLDKLTVTPASFYQRMRAGRSGRATTSQPSPAEYKTRFDFLLAHHSSVLCLALSGGLSGTCDSARAAARMCGPSVRVIDTRSASVGAGLLARRAAEAIAAGGSLEEVSALVESLVPRVRIHFTVPTLEHLVASGRVSRSKGRLARLLNLKPIIQVNAASGGKTVQGPTVFGLKAGRRRIVRLVEGEVPRGRPVEIAIAHSNLASEAELLRAELAARVKLAREPYIVDVTAVLATHIGEGAVGLAYIMPDLADGA